MNSNTIRLPCPKCNQLMIPYLYGMPSGPPTPQMISLGRDVVYQDSWEAYRIGDAASVEPGRNNNTHTG